MTESARLEGYTPPLFGEERPRPTNDDWYTPAWMFDRMGITWDLDVASPPGGVPWIPAERYYTYADDGLHSPWAGTVWCNPPFSQAKLFRDRMIDHGDGALLLPVGASGYPAYTMGLADLVWLPDHHLEFTRADGASGAGKIPYAVMVCAFGVRATAAVARLNRGVHLVGWATDQARGYGGLPVS